MGKKQTKFANFDTEQFSDWYFFCETKIFYDHKKISKSVLTLGLGDGESAIISSSSFSRSSSITAEAEIFSNLVSDGWFLASFSNNFCLSFRRFSIMASSSSSSESIFSSVLSSNLDLSWTEICFDKVWEVFLIFLFCFQNQKRP